jgi:uncharacterized protein
MTTPESHTGRLLGLEPDECWTLAASQPVGRLAWNGPEGPTVVPVNFEVTGRRVHIRTAAYSVLARECDDSVVAFEVDAFDPETRSGWSVLMRGRAHLDYDGDADGNDDPDVWVAGARALRVTVDVEKVTGRRIA